MKKIKYVIALSLVFVLVIGTNIMDNSSFQVVKNSIQNIYEDRLVAYDLTFKMYKEFTHKKLLLTNADTTGFKSNRAESEENIRQLIARYEATKLTKKEDEYFDNLKSQIKDLLAYEKQLVKDFDNTKTQVYDNKLDKISETLNALTEIQIDEGKRQLVYSNRAIDSSNTLSKLEIGIIIFVGLVIQFIIIYEPKSRKITAEDMT